MALLFLLCASRRFAFSERIDPGFFGALQWRNIGPNRGGRSIAAAGAAARASTSITSAPPAAACGRRPTAGPRGGRSLTGRSHTSSVGAVAVSESNPDIVYLGMGETELRANVMQGDGVYKSTDAGKTWKNIDQNDTQSISRIRIDPVGTRMQRTLRRFGASVSGRTSGARRVSAPATAARRGKRFSTRTIVRARWIYVSILTMRA